MGNSQPQMSGNSEPELKVPSVPAVVAFVIGLVKGIIGIVTGFALGAGISVLVTLYPYIHYLKDTSYGSVLIGFIHILVGGVTAVVFCVWFSRMRSRHFISVLIVLPFLCVLFLFLWWQFMGYLTA